MSFEKIGGLLSGALFLLFQNFAKRLMESYFVFSLTKLVERSLGKLNNLFLTFMGRFDVMI